MWYQKLSLLGIFCALLGLARAQNGGKTSLTEYFSELEKKYEVTFSFDSELIKGVPFVSPSKSKNLRAALGYLSAHSAFDYKLANAKNVLVIPKYQQHNFYVCGKIVDFDTKEAILGAGVQINGQTGTYVKDDGSFFISLDYKAKDSITVSSYGYQKIRMALNSFANGECKSIALVSSYKQLTEVVVVSYLTEGITFDGMDHSITLRPKNHNLLPGQQNGDILYSMDALPGVSSPDSKAGNLNMRGSPADQTFISFDHIPIYLRGHFFGTLSPFNANFVDRINVQRSVMSLDKGGRVGGSIDIYSPTSVANKFQCTALSSAYDAALSVQTPIVKNKLSILASARKSYPFSVSNPSFEAITNFVFQESEIYALLKGNSPDNLKLEKLDYSFQEANLKLAANLSEKHKAGISLLYLHNEMLVDRASKQLNSRRVDKFTFANWGVSGNFSSVWNSKLKSDVVLSASQFEQNQTNTNSNYASSTIYPSNHFDNLLGDYRISASMDYKIKPNLYLKAGYNGILHSVSYKTQAIDSINTSFFQHVDQLGQIHTLYAMFNGIWRQKWLFQAGFRANYYTLTKKPNLEPRLLLSYRVKESLRLRLSAGAQKQFLNQISGVAIESIGGVESQLWLLADAKVIPEVYSYQMAAGGMYEKKNWLIELEGYYKKVNKVSSISLKAPESLDPFIHGNIETMGLDLLIRKTIKDLSVWSSYTLSHSMMRFDSINNGARFNSLYDQTHVLDLAFSYDWKQFKISMSWKYRTGLSALPGIRTRMLHGAPSGGNAPTGGLGPLPTEIDGKTRYTDRFPDYHQLDATISYQFPKKQRKWNGSIGLSCLNIYNQSNVIEQLIVIKTGKPEIHDMTMLKRTPNAYLKISF